MPLISLCRREPTIPSALLLSGSRWALLQAVLKLHTASGHELLLLIVTPFWYADSMARRESGQEGESQEQEEHRGQGQGGGRVCVERTMPTNTIPTGSLELMIPLKPHGCSCVKRTVQSSTQMMYSVEYNSSMIRMSPVHTGSTGGLSRAPTSTPTRATMRCLSGASNKIIAALHCTAACHCWLCLHLLVSLLGCRNTLCTNLEALQGGILLRLPVCAAK